MNKFSDFNITTTLKGFEGDKIKMAKILNKEIVIHDFKIEDSKVFPERGHGKCLHLQISSNGDKYVVFTSGGALIEAIKSIPAHAFPFVTTIVLENDRLKFT